MPIANTADAVRFAATGRWSPDNVKEWLESRLVVEPGDELAARALAVLVAAPADVPWPHTALKNELRALLEPV